MTGRGRVEEMCKSNRHNSGDGGAILISFFFCSFLLSNCYWDGRVYG